jgi:hypothetical protein
MSSVDEGGIAMRSKDCEAEDSAACELRGEQAKLDWWRW